MIKGFVVDNNDPEKRGRVLVSAPDAMLDPETGAIVPMWCEPTGGADGEGAGIFNVPTIGAPVWITATGGDDCGIDRVFYKAGQFYGESPAPLTSRGEEANSTGSMRLSANFKLPSPQNQLGISGRRDASLQTVEIDGTPESYNAGVYPHVRTIRTLGGVELEIDDTPGATRITIWHPSGACYEISDKGVVAQRATRHWVESVDTHTTVVGGNCQTSVAGNRQTQIAANDVAEVRGRCCTVVGEYNLKSRSNIITEASNSAIVKVGGNYDLSAGAGLQETVIGDRTSTVAGSISNTAIYNVNTVAAKVCESCTTHTALCATKYEITTPMFAVNGLVRLGPEAEFAGSPLVKSDEFGVAFGIWAKAIASAMKSLSGGQVAAAAVELANDAMALALEGAQTLSVKAV